MQQKKENILIYDKKGAERFNGIFDIATPEETQKAFNKKIIF